jgi:hypothetical protein
MTPQEALDIFTEMSERDSGALISYLCKYPQKVQDAARIGAECIKNVMKIDLLLQCWEEVDDGQEHT